MSSKIHSIATIGWLLENLVQYQAICRCWQSFQISSRDASVFLCHPSTRSLAGVVWAMKFSHDGKFLASAGQDGMVYVWEVGSHRGEPPEGSAGQEAKPSGATSPPKGSPTAKGSPIAGAQRQSPYCEAKCAPAEP